MLSIRCPDEFRAAIRKARELGGNARASLKLCLQRLGSGPDCVCELYKDFAPFSFYFVLKRNGKTLFNGGVIFHGRHDGGGNGSAPTFSVSLSSERGERWEIHT